MIKNPESIRNEAELWYQYSFGKKELSHYCREKIICNSRAVKFLFLTTVYMYFIKFLKLCWFFQPACCKNTDKPAKTKSSSMAWPTRQTMQVMIFEGVLSTIPMLCLSLDIYKFKLKTCKSSLIQGHITRRLRYNVPDKGYNFWRCMNLILSQNIAFHHCTSG